MYYTNKRAISVGGGKGGVGKSSFASNLAVALTRHGKKVLLIDTDIEASNLHTFVGINYPRVTLDDFLNGSVSSIQQIVLDTPFKHLQLISSAGSALSLSGLKYAQRLRFIKSVFQLETDIIIFDIAAGTNMRAIDYFSLAPVMVIMIEPVPTSLENAFVFLKNLVYRHLLRIFYTDKEASRLILARLSDRRAATDQSFDDLLSVLSKSSPEKTGQYRSFLLSLNNIFLVLNRVSTSEQNAIIDRFARVIKRYLHITCRCGGSLPVEPRMDEHIIARTPLLVNLPESSYGIAMEKILANLF